MKERLKLLFALSYATAQSDWTRERAVLHYAQISRNTESGAERELDQLIRQSSQIEYFEDCARIYPHEDDLAGKVRLVKVRQ